MHKWVKIVNSTSFSCKSEVNARSIFGHAQECYLTYIPKMDGQIIPKRNIGYKVQYSTRSIFITAKTKNIWIHHHCLNNTANFPPIKSAGDPRVAKHTL